MFGSKDKKGTFEKAIDDLYGLGAYRKECIKSIASCTDQKKFLEKINEMIEKTNEQSLKFNAFLMRDGGYAETYNMHIEMLNKNDKSLVDAIAKETFEEENSDRPSKI